MRTKLTAVAALAAAAVTLAASRRPDRSQRSSESRSR